MKKRNKPGYINNKEFSQEVCEYVSEANKCIELGGTPPIIPNKIAKGFQQIAEGLSRKPNFYGYSYRDEMVMDGIENCLRAIRNYNIEAATRSGSPNAFAYFTQICYYAFLRRIEKEKKQQDLKQASLENSLSSELIGLSQHQDDMVTHVANSYIESIKNEIDKEKEFTDELNINDSDDYGYGRKKVRRTNDSDLMEFYA